MNILVYLVILALVTSFCYYVALRVSKDSTFAFFVGVVIFVVGLFSKGLLG